jgi:hypothetical protein
MSQKGLALVASHPRQRFVGFQHKQPSGILVTCVRLPQHAPFFL